MAQLDGIDGGSPFDDWAAADNPTPGNQLATITCATIAIDVRTKFGDSASVQLGDEDIIRWINAGARRIASGAPWIKRSVTTPLLEGVSTYDLAEIQRDLVTIDSLIVDGRSVQLIGWQDFLNRTAGVNDSTDPTLPAGPFAALYGDRLNLRPVPSATVAQGLVLYFTSLPAPISTLQDFLPVPDRFANALNDYVFQQALEFDERFEEAEVKRTHTESAIREQLADDVSPTGYYPAITQVGANEW